jgi:hypothetical protein
MLSNQLAHALIDHHRISTSHLPPPIPAGLRTYVYDGFTLSEITHVSKTRDRETGEISLILNMEKVK